MEKEKLLKELLTLKSLLDSCEDAQKKLGILIEDTEMEVKAESRRTVAVGESNPAMRKLLMSNRTKAPSLAYMIRITERKRDKYILTNTKWAIKTKSDHGLPVSEDEIGIGAAMNKAITSAKSKNKCVVPMPTRAELDYIVKRWRSATKKDRTAFPEYSFGVGCPVVDARILSEMINIFHSQEAYIDKSAGKNSSVFFNFSLYEGIITC